MFLSDMKAVLIDITSNGNGSFHYRDGNLKKSSERKKAREAAVGQL